MQTHLPHPKDSEITITEKLEFCKKAILCGTNSVSIHPSYHIAWFLYGNSYFSMGSLVEIQADSLAKTNKQIAVVKYNEALKMYNEAFRAYDNVQRIRPEFKDVNENIHEKYKSRGNVYGKIGNDEASLKDFETANKYANNKNPEVLRLLVASYGLKSLNELLINSLESSQMTFDNALLYAQNCIKISPKYLLPTLRNLELLYKSTAEKEVKFKVLLNQRAADLNSIIYRIDPSFK